ncbi:MAG: saccharopine dehydrogenase [Candidatus Heimdallarchaeota archaeon]|nr:saccharopine dehydrogenase [Candidatus Heimdallarchaeota archaeon]
MKSKILIYGVYGYTGSLIAELAISQSLQIIIAGRDMYKVKTMAERLEVEYRFFDLHPDELLFQFKDVLIVINCAGPFSSTAKVVAEGCLATNTHYLDITGEIDVFESLQRLNQQAQEKDIMIMPGTGFDVVATDCLAKYLSMKMPDADRLELSFHGMKKISPGTTKSQVERLKVGGGVREDGVLKVVPMLSKSQELSFVKDDGTKITKQTYLIPWGDLSTAYWTTKIANIEVYQHFPKSMVRLAKGSRYIRWLLKLKWYENFVKWMQLKMNPPLKIGETSESRMLVRGTVWDTEGNSLSARSSTSEGYQFTAEATVTIAQKILSGDFKAGYQTPAGCYGEELFNEIPNTSEFIEFEHE